MKTMKIIRSSTITFKARGASVIRKAQRKLDRIKTLTPNQTFKTTRSAPSFKLG